MVKLYAVVDSLLTTELDSAVKLDLAVEPGWIVNWTAQPGWKFESCALKYVLLAPRSSQSLSLECNFLWLTRSLNVLRFT